MGRLGRLRFVGDREETPTTARCAVPCPSPARVLRARALATLVRVRHAVPFGVAAFRVAAFGSRLESPPRGRRLPSRRLGVAAADSAAAPAWDPVRDPLPPGRARQAGRAVQTWSRGPSGRLVLPGALLLALIGVTAAAGALVLPATAPEPRSADAPPAASLDPTFPGGVPSTAPALPGDTAFPTAPTYPTTPTTPAGRRAAAADRPARGRARRLGAAARTRVGIPVVAVQAYGYAELVARPAPRRAAG